MHIVWFFAGFLWWFVFAVICTRQVEFRLAVLGILACLAVVAFGFYGVKDVMVWVGDFVEASPDWHCLYGSLQAQCNGSMAVGHLVFTIGPTFWNLFVAPVIAIALMCEKLFKQMKH